MVKRLLWILLLFLVADVYFYQAITTLTQNSLLHIGYWSLDLLLLGGIITIISVHRAGHNMQRWIAGLMSGVLLVFIPKLVASPVLLAEDIVRLLEGFPPRSIYVSEVAVALALLMFLIILFGLTRGRHFYKVKRETLYFHDLPEAFDGFTITQISDIHSGSFSNARGVQKGIDLVNAQDSDLLLFTGDLVNHMATEMDPWIPAFTTLKAPYGKYSVLGNHDYGDYVTWDSKEERAANLERLKQVHAKLGWRLLLDEHVSIEKDGEKIGLLGVQNISRTNSFHSYGNMAKAHAGSENYPFKILMSHDPSHWDGEVNKKYGDVDLMLSGHTHGAQFGVELPGFRWSPVQYVYKQWAGLYENETGSQKLYINRGYGFIGYPGRVGILPEITLLELS